MKISSEEVQLVTIETRTTQFYFTSRAGLLSVEMCPYLHYSTYTELTELLITGNPDVTNHKTRIYSVIPPGSDPDISVALTAL